MIITRIPPKIAMDGKRTIWGTGNDSEQRRISKKYR
jgi:hypothetical protein